MKVLQKKILTLVISSILISALVVMIIAFSNYDHIIESNSRQIMQLMCSEKRQKIDEKLLNIEQSVHTIYHFAVEQISETDSSWQDEEVFSEHIIRMGALMNTAAQYTDGAVSVYYRLLSDIDGTLSGVWLTQDQTGKFVEHELTDISLYEEDDIERVGWYYIPIANRKETWINPYYNQNMGEEIISYVIPIIIDGEVLGVVGMDISTSLLYDHTKSVTVYDTGYAFLMDNEGKFVYHPDMEGNLFTVDFDNQHAYLYEKSLLSAKMQSVEAYRWNNIDKNLTSQMLRNGMIFTVCVTEEEIKQPQQQMLFNSVLVILLIMSIFVVVTGSIIKVIIRLMYTDSMTRVGNKTAYTECIDNIYKRLAVNDKFSFTVIVTDINDLKKVNDTYGHEYGDMLIQNGAAILKKIWRSDFIYRIGGDEFVIIYFDVEKELVAEKILLFEDEIKKHNRQNSTEKLFLQMAIGMAVYNPETDKAYMDVFRRADSAMYENKREKKSKSLA